MIRPVWFICGVAVLILAVIGMFLPLLPTVPFLLLSAFFFARSSERAHAWLVNHDVFGPPIRDWQRSGAIARKAKWVATASIIAAFLLAFVFNVPQKVLLIQVATLFCVGLFIWTRPES